MPNPLDSKATQRFIEVTHRQYKRRLGELHDCVEAYFTDEPSMNAVNMPLLPDHVRSRYQAADPLDPNVPRLPMIPWSAELEQELAKDGKSINKKSLFTGDSDFDRLERQRFWEAVARLYARFYHRAILDWCHENGVASSGHLLGEESLLGHTPFDGDKMKMMRLYDIPGLDQLNSWPKVVHYGGWKTLALPASAAALNGTRFVMTEISDHSQKNAAENPKPASLDWMKAAAAGQAAWGVTEFTLYYQIGDRGEAGHKEYCDYVGRLNAILRAAKPEYAALLYYPTVELQQEYLPTTEPLRLENQSKKMQEVIHSFERLGRILTHDQIPMILVDQQGLKDWIERTGRKDWPLLIPKSVEIPDSVRNSGAKILIDSDTEPMNIEKIRLMLDSTLERFEPSSSWLVYGKFRRDGRTIYVVSNSDDQAYEGVLSTAMESAWQRFYPESGRIDSLPKSRKIPLSLKTCETMIFVAD